MSLKRPYPTPTPPPSKRRRVNYPSLPHLPADVWHTIASMLGPTSLGNLAQTAHTQRLAAEDARDTAMWRALHLTLCCRQPGEGHALGRLIHSLDTAPSLRHKHVARQMRLLTLGERELAAEGVHFTAEQARAFLGVEEGVLTRWFEPVSVRGVRMRRKPRCVLAFAAFPPDVRRDAPVYGLGSVLRAARICHGEFGNVERVVRERVGEDWRRFERAERAEGEVVAVAAEFGVPKREVEYALNASEGVVEFRQGRWGGGDVGAYVRLVRSLFEVHCALGGCYQVLLICDGNARLKAKRIVGKMLRSGREWRTGEVVRALEGNLWWARSKTNVQKMEEMSRNMPHIRV